MTAPRKRGGVSCVHEVETASHSLVYMGTNAERNDLLQCLAPPDGARSPVERSRLEDGVVGDARALVSGHYCSFPPNFLVRSVCSCPLS